MIGLDFTLENTSEKDATRFFQQIGYIFTEEASKLLPFPFVPSAMDWIYRRTSGKTSEPPLELINLGLEHHIRASAHPTDNTHRTWHFRLQSPNHVIPIQRPGKPQIYTLQPDKVSQLFHRLARIISTKIPTPIHYHDDHTRQNITFQHGKPTKNTEKKAYPE